MANIRKRTKIVATLGPSSESSKVLTTMIQNGVDVVRLNFSHGTHEHHEMLIRRVHQVARKVGKTVAVLQDLSGPKLRVGDLPDSGVKLVRGREFKFTVFGTFEDGDVPSLPLPMRGFPQFVKRGTRLLLDDGKIEVRVVSKSKSGVKVRVMQGGTLLSHKGINIPDAAVPISPITPKDRKDLLFGLRMGVDAIALSFVQSADDIRSLRRLIARYEKNYRLRSVDEAPVKVFAKIEKPAAVTNFDAILEEVDGVMIARGDLALEVGYEQVPVLQKDMIAKAVAASKPAIVATQMLESMMERSHPTRAEVSDVSNAVVDHADAVMLSGETAVGAHPAQTIKVMRDTILETEASSFDDVVIAQSLVEGRDDVEAAVAGTAGLLASLAGADGLLVASLSGSAARLVSHERPELPIFAIAEDPRVERQLAFSWGVIPVYLSTPSRSVEELVRRAIQTVFRRQLVSKKARLVVVARQPVGKDGPINFIHLQGE